MSVQQQPSADIPEQTQRIARAAFPKGHPYLLLRDQLGTIFRDEDFRDLFSQRGQPAWSPWRLALITVLQFRENLSDRQTADAVRSRLDWKYLLGLAVDDPGFDYSVLSEFRQRLINHQGEMRLLDKLLIRCQELNLMEAGGTQRTDATYILGAVRVMTRLEQIGESMRAVLNELATLTPDWLQSWVPQDWYERYQRRMEQQRFAKSEADKERFALTIGQDAFHLLNQIQRDERQLWLLNLPKVVHLQAVLARHYNHQDGEIHYKDKQEVSKLPPDVESPYDPEVRYRLRRERQWVGYQGHLSETCDDHLPHLITAVATTSATEHEIAQVAPLHERLDAIGALPHQHVVDSAYLSAEELQRALQDYGIELIGPPRQDTSWQARTEGAFDYTHFAVDWDRQRVQCPQGHYSRYWYGIDENSPNRAPGIRVRFDPADCSACPVKANCTHAPGARTLRLPIRPLYEALETARTFSASEAGTEIYKKRAGIEGTISQAVRAFGARRSRYIGLAKTHLQLVAIAAAINLERLAAWFSDIPRAKTRVSAFAALAPH